MPRVVNAGVPRRMPLGRSGGCGSSGITCLLTVRPASSRAFSATRPSMPNDLIVSMTIR